MPSGARAPLVGLMVYPQILSEPWLATYTNRSLGSTARDLGPFPVGKGEPVICVRAPVASLMAYPDTSFEDKLAT